MRLQRFQFGPQHRHQLQARSQLNGLIDQHFGRANIIVLRHHQRQFVQTLHVIELFQYAGEQWFQFNVLSGIEFGNALLMPFDVRHIARRFQNFCAQRSLPNRCDALIQYVVQWQMNISDWVAIATAQQLQRVGRLDVSNVEKMVRRMRRWTMNSNLPMSKWPYFVSNSNFKLFSRKFTCTECSRYFMRPATADNA